MGFNDLAIFDNVSKFNCYFLRVFENNGYAILDPVLGRWINFYTLRADDFCC